MLDARRAQLGFSSPGTVLFKASPGISSDELIVEANGFGGAALMVGSGNYPIDFSVELLKQFPTEAEAMDIAERLYAGELPLAGLFEGGT